MLPVGGEFTFHLAILEGEVIRVNRADRAKVLVLKRAVRHLAAKDVAVFVQRDDHCAAELAEPGIKVGLLIFGMILLSEHEHHRGLITEWLRSEEHTSELQ